MTVSCRWRWPVGLAAVIGGCKAQRRWSGAPRCSTAAAWLSACLLVCVRDSRSIVVRDTPTRASSRPLGAGGASPSRLQLRQWRARAGRAARGVLLAAGHYHSGLRLVVVGVGARAVAATLKSWRRWPGLHLVA